MEGRGLLTAPALLYASEFPRITLLRLSENSRMRLHRSLTSHRKVPFRPVLTFVYPSKPTVGALLLPFSDSLANTILGNSGGMKRAGAVRDPGSLRKRHLLLGNLSHRCGIRARTEPERRHDGRNAAY